MNLFENKIQEIKYKVIREVAVQTWKENDVFAEFNEIAVNIAGKDAPPYRCCIYKDRAIIAERVRLAIGGSKKKNNIVQIIDIACDECPESGYLVTDLCRGCLAHYCMSTCRMGAISIDENHHAKIDKTKCVDCGLCAAACPYSAIHNFKRPCQSACTNNAISIGTDGSAVIDEEECISCGACVYRCPFGAPVDVSGIVDVIRSIKESEAGGRPVIAMMAPAIAAQCKTVKAGQVVSGLKAMGFDDVVEVAAGADVVAADETKELIEKGFLISSCCPAFVQLIEKRYPDLLEHVSHNPSPMVATAKIIRERIPNAVTVFIGPCIAKKSEGRRPEVDEYVDYVITFEELQALFDSKEIILKELEESPYSDASYYGRNFSRSGGLSTAVGETLKEMEESEFVVDPMICNGVDECKKALLMAQKGILKNNFIEGMICKGGCVGGAGNMIKHPKPPRKMESHLKDGATESVLESAEKFKKGEK